MNKARVDKTLCDPESSPFCENLFIYIKKKNKGKQKKKMSQSSKGANNIISMKKLELRM